MTECPWCGEEVWEDDIFGCIECDTEICSGCATFDGYCNECDSREFDSDEEDDE